MVTTVSSKGFPDYLVFPLLLFPPCYFKRVKPYHDFVEKLLVSILIDRYKLMTLSSRIRDRTVYYDSKYRSGYGLRVPSSENRGSSVSLTFN